MADDNKQTEFDLEVTGDNSANASQEEEVEIQIESDNVKKGTTRTSSEDGEDDVQKTLATLKKKLEEEKKAREEAEERARQVSHKLNAAYNEVEDSNISLITTAIETVKRENEYLKNDYRNALAMSDFD